MLLQGTYSKVKYGEHVETGEAVAVKVLDKEHLIRTGALGGEGELDTLEVVRAQSTRSSANCTECTVYVLNRVGNTLCWIRSVLDTLCVTVGMPVGQQRRGAAELQPVRCRELQRGGTIRMAACVPRACAGRSSCALPALRCAGMVEQIKREITILKQIHHPNIVDLKEVCHGDCSFVLVFVCARYAWGAGLCVWAAWQAGRQAPGTPEQQDMSAAAHAVLHAARAVLRCAAGHGVQGQDLCGDGAGHWGRAI